MAAKIHFFIETTKQKKKKDRTGPEIRAIRVIRVQNHPSLYVLKRLWVGIFSFSKKRIPVACNEKNP